MACIIDKQRLVKMKEKQNTLLHINSMIHVGKKHITLNSKVHYFNQMFIICSKF